MAELRPIPFSLLVRRAFREYEREGKIFDLPRDKWFRGFPGIDLSVDYHGHRASTPLGPAAGPHGQLAQNIVLGWLGGSRIIELKTVQVLDELTIPRPCIDAANVGFNVEWSQELHLDQSLREYVGAAMLIEMLVAENVLGAETPCIDTIFDMSVGYNLEGIRSPRITGWIELMKHAAPVIDELREQLDGPWRRFRDLPFPHCLSDTVTLSTFHGCPAGEIEGITQFLMSEMGVNVCIKMNPTLLGAAQVEHLLHDVLGYREIQLHPPAFANDLKMDEALDLIPRLEALGRTYGRSLSLKFSNTLVVKNHKGKFQDELMYMSGAPLHVITMNLVAEFRRRFGRVIPTSFSAGLDAHNIAAAVAMNLVPVTTCTDLLRAGGYARLIRYLEILAEKMRDAGVHCIPDFVVRSGGHAEDVIACASASLPVPPETEAKLKDWLNWPGRSLASVCSGAPGLEALLVGAAGMVNTPRLVEEATANPRYAWERNKGEPRKIGSKLAIYDCIACDKCVPACPNDANFTYETSAAEMVYSNLMFEEDQIRAVAGGTFRVRRARQFANYADACNECGQCAILCPEDGGPFITKPRFFGSIESYEQHAGENGFHLAFDRGRKSLFGRMGSGSYLLILDKAADRAWFHDGSAEVELELSTNRPLFGYLRPGRGTRGQVVDMLPYYQLKLLAESVADPKHIHFANVGGVR